MSKTLRVRDSEEEKIEKCFRDQTDFSLDDSGDSYLSHGTKETVTSGFMGDAGTLVTSRMTDWVTSNYKARVKRGEIINNPCTREKVTSIVEPVHWLRERSFLTPVCSMWPDPGDIPNYRKGVRYSGHYPSSIYLGQPLDASTWTLDEPVISTGDMEDLAVTTAYARIDTSDAAALVTAGEIRETVDFIADTARRMVRIYKHARKFKLRALRGEITRSELAKRYLEYRYALRPMVSEIDTYVTALIQTSSPSRQTYRAKEHKAEIALGDTYVTYSSSNYGTIEAVETCCADVVVRAGVLCALDVQNLDRWGFTKPIDAAWDLIPLSFIADWFFNIGHTIASFTPEQGIKELASWCSVTKIVTREKRFVTAKLPTVPVYYDSHVCDTVRNNPSGGSVQLITETYERKINPERAILPTFKLKLDKWKLLDIGLILKQLAS